MKTYQLVVCADLECREVYAAELPACPDCTCTQSIPLSRLTEGAGGVELIGKTLAGDHEEAIREDERREREGRETSRFLVRRTA